MPEEPQEAKDPPPTLQAVQGAIAAGMGPRGVMIARAFSKFCDSAEMLQLAALLSEHGMIAPLAGMWRNRQREPEEATPYAEALNGLANMMAQQGRLDDALRVLREAGSEAPQLAHIQRNIASILLERGEYEGALAICGRLLDANPQDFETAELTGMIQYNTGDPELAVENLQLAFESGRVQAGMWLLKACVLANRDGDAAQTLRRLDAEHHDRASVMLQLELQEPGSPLHTLQGAPGMDVLVRKLLA